MTFPLRHGTYRAYKYLSNLFFSCFIYTIRYTTGMRKIYRMLLGQHPNSTRPIGTEKTLKEAKEYILSRAYNNDYCAIYVADDENPAGELVGRWIVKNKKLTSFEKKTKPIDYKKKIF